MTTWHLRPGTRLTFDLCLSVVLAVSIWLAFTLPESLTQHMLAQFGLMSAAAPFTAWMLRRIQSKTLFSGKALGLATGMQIAAIWLWHAPGVFELAMISPSLRMVMPLTLFVLALSFWMAVLGTEEERRWRSILALLITGKVFCLLAVLLVFAPRPLYSLICYGSNAVDPLADQRLAGLAMLAVCPLTYVAAGVAVAARWFGELGRGEATEGAG